MATLAEENENGYFTPGYKVMQSSIFTMVDSSNALKLKFPCDKSGLIFVWIPKS